MALMIWGTCRLWNPFIGFAQLNNFNFSIRGFKFYKRLYFFWCCHFLEVQILDICHSFQCYQHNVWSKLKFHFVVFYFRVNTSFRVFDIVINTIHLYLWRLKKMKVGFFFPKQRTWILKQHCFLESSQASTICLSGIKYCWNDNDSQKNPTSCYFVRHKSHMGWPGLELDIPRWQDLFNL